MQHQQVLEQILSAFDIGENSRQLYVACFEQGEKSIGSLAGSLGMDRSSAYLAVNQLKQAGLVEIDESKRPMLVRAIEPKRILGRIERKIQDLEERFDDIHSNLPKLESAYKLASSRPLLQSYSGKPGLVQIVEDILGCQSGEILLFTNPDSETAVFNKHDHDYFIRQRLKNNLTIKVIATNCEAARQLQAGDKKSLRQTKIVDGPAPFSSELYIYDNNVAMLSFREEIIGLTISSSDYSEMLRWQFFSIWERL